MATTATAEYYDKQAALTKSNADIAYNTALANLARRFGSANRQLEANMEARGILRSGEANTYRTELTAEEQAEKTAAEMAKLGAYNQAEITLAEQMAALNANNSGSSGGGSSSGSSGGGGAQPPASPARPATPANQVTKTGMLIGSADTIERRLANNPPVYDFSKVDFKALGRLMEAQKPKPPSPAKQTATFATTGLYGVARPVRDARGR